MINLGSKPSNMLVGVGDGLFGVRAIRRCIALALLIPLAWLTPLAYLLFSLHFFAGRPPFDCDSLRLKCNY